MRLKTSVTISKDTRRLDAMLKQMAKLAHAPDNQVGWWGDTYSDGTTVAQVANWNEIGHFTKTGAFSPPRPFYRVGVMMEIKKTGFQTLKAPLINLLMGKGSVAAVNRAIREEMVSKVKASILAWNTPENSPVTIAMKGFNDPLIHTGKMYDKVKGRVSR